MSSSLHGGGSVPSGLVRWLITINGVTVSHRCNVLAPKAGRGEPDLPVARYLSFQCYSVREQSWRNIWPANGTGRIHGVFIRARGLWVPSTEPEYHVQLQYLLQKIEEDPYHHQKKCFSWYTYKKKETVKRVVFEKWCCIFPVVITTQVPFACSRVRVYNCNGNVGNKDIHHTKSHGLAAHNLSLHWPCCQSAAISIR